MGAPQLRFRNAWLPRGRIFSWIELVQEGLLMATRSGSCGIKFALCALLSLVMVVLVFVLQLLETLLYV